MTTTVDAFLGGQLQIEQPKHGYRAGVDPVLLAAACPAVTGDQVLDLGCGVGTAGLCLAKRVGCQVTGVELLPEQARLAVANGQRNGIPMDVQQGDATSRPTVLSGQSFNHVITNPPFFDPNKGPVSKNETRGHGRSGDVDLGLWIGTAYKRLHPKGWLTLIQRVDRLPDVLRHCEGFGNIQILPLAARLGRDPHLFIMRARKNARTPFRLHSPLIMHIGAVHTGDWDSYTAEIRDVLRKGSAVNWPH